VIIDRRLSGAQRTLAAEVNRAWKSEHPPTEQQLADWFRRLLDLAFHTERLEDAAHVMEPLVTRRQWSAGL